MEWDSLLIFIFHFQKNIIPTLCTIYNILPLKNSSFFTSHMIIFTQYITKTFSPLMFCWLCILIHPCNKTNMMHYLSSVYFVSQPEVDWRNKLRINSASRWFSLYGSPLNQYTNKPNMHWMYKTNAQNYSVCLLCIPPVHVRLVL